MNIKKIICSIAVILLLFSLTACTSDISQSNSGKMKVVTVIFPEYDFARAVCGKYADVYMITKPGAEIHGYEPSLSDINMIRSADLLVYTGGESQQWIDKILNSFDGKKIKTLRLMDSVDLLYEEHPDYIGKEHHDHEDGSDVHDGSDKANYSGYDEHIWLSFSNANKMLRAISDSVSESDPGNSDYYKKNTDEYVEKISAADMKMHDVLSGAKRKIIAVGDRFPFLYFVKQYGIDYCAAFSGCSPEYDANPSTIIYITEAVKKNNIPVVFTIELSDGRMADTICEETGAKKLVLNSCQNISKSDFNSGLTYADIMNQNIINLKEALY